MDVSRSPYVGPHSPYSEGLLRINSNISIIINNNGVLPSQRGEGTGTLPA